MLVKINRLLTIDVSIFKLKWTGIERPKKLILLSTCRHRHCHL